MIHFIVWIIVSGIAGFVASKIINKSGSGLFLDIVLGIVGGFVGGFIVDDILGLGLRGRGFILEVIVAILGAMLVIWLYNLIFRRSVRRSGNWDSVSRGTETPPRQQPSGNRDTETLPPRQQPSGNRDTETLPPRQQPSGNWDSVSRGTETPPQQQPSGNGDTETLPPRQQPRR